MTVISYPIPVYQNLPINADFYQPSRFVIENITLGETTIVTTTEDMNYVEGQLVRLLIPAFFGTSQLNGVQAYVISLPAANQVELDVTSIGMNSFVLATGNLPCVAQIVAIGDINTGTQNATGRVNLGTTIPGSFIDISPN